MTAKQIVFSRMSVRQTAVFEAHGNRFRVTRLGIDSFVMKQEGRDRARFGNLREIRQDVSYALECGQLPARHPNPVA
jgi:hypothetical protein